MKSPLVNLVIYFIDDKKSSNSIFYKACLISYMDVLSALVINQKLRTNILHLMQAVYVS